MPPKKDPPKTTTSDGKPLPGKESHAQSSSTADGGAKEFDFSVSSLAAQKVRLIADRLQVATGIDAKLLSDVVVKRLRDHEFLDPAKLKDMETFVKSSKGSEVGQLIEELKAMQFEGPVSDQSDAHPGIKQLDFRPLLVKARENIHGNFDGLVEWLVSELELDLCGPGVQTLNAKKDEFKTQSDATWRELDEDLKKKLSDAPRRLSFDLGRESVVWDHGELGAGPEEQRLVEMDALKSRVGALENELRGAGQQNADLVHEITDLKRQNSGMEGEIEEAQRREAELQEQEADKKIAELEQQLMVSDEKLSESEATREQLRELLDSCLDKDESDATGMHGAKNGPDVTEEVKVDDDHSKTAFESSESTSGVAGTFSGGLGRTSTKTEASGSAPSPAGTYNDRLAEAIEMLVRNQTLSNLPPPPHFSGDKRKDKMGLGQFLEMYERRVLNCPGEMKVTMLSEYLVGEAYRAYKCALNSDARLTFDQLCKQMKGRMVDSTPTGRLLKMKRFDELRIYEGQPYSSFIMLLENEVLEAYGDSDEQTIDRMKTKVLLGNLRDRDLVMQVGTELRRLRADEWQFPVVKDLAITYESNAWSANRWQSQGKRHYDRDANESQPMSDEQNSNAAGKSGGPSENSKLPTPPARATSGARAPYQCYNCKEMGHRSFECPKRRSGPESDGPKFGNFKPPVCHACGETGHIRPNCPKQGSANAATQSASVTGRPENDMTKGNANAFFNMCSETPSDDDLTHGIVGRQCTAPILVNGVTVTALFDLGSQVNIISRDCIRKVLREGNQSYRKLPGNVGHPHGVNMMDASGAPMKFAGLVHCMIQTDASDKAEEHKFLVQENANYDVVLGTPLLLANTKWCERLQKLLTDMCQNSAGPCTGEGLNSSVFSMPVIPRRAVSDVVSGRQFHWSQKVRRAVRARQTDERRADPRSGCGPGCRERSKTRRRATLPLSVVSVTSGLPMSCKVQLQKAQELHGVHQEFELVRRKSVVQIRVADVVQAVVDGRGLQTSKTAIVRGFNDFLFTSETRSGSSSRTGQKRRSSDVLATLNLSQDFFKCASSRAPARDVPFRGGGGGRQRACGCGSSNFGSRRRHEQ